LKTPGLNRNGHLQEQTRGQSSAAAAMNGVKADLGEGALGISES
jgi:hypothetical protein